MLRYLIVNLATLWRFARNLFGWIFAPRAMIRGADVNGQAFYFSILNFFVVCTLINLVAGKALDAAFAPDLDGSARLASAMQVLGVFSAGDLERTFGAQFARLIAAIDVISDNLVVLAGVLQASASAMISYLIVKVVAPSYRFRHAMMVTLPLQGALAVVSTAVGVAYVVLYMSSGPAEPARFEALYSRVAGEGLLEKPEYGAGLSPCAAVKQARLNDPAAGISVECRAHLAAIEQHGAAYPWASALPLYLGLSWFLIAAYLIVRVGFGVSYWAQIGAVLFGLVTLLMGPLLVFVYRWLRRSARRRA